MPKTSTRPHISTRRGLLSLSPMMLFMALYLAVSLFAGDFYAMPLPVAFAAASAWGLATIRNATLPERVEVFSRGAAQPGILYMIWVYILAGAFATLAKGCGAIDATVALALRYLPSAYILPGLFAAACFISVSIGTSVGTVVALCPLAVSIAQAGGCEVPLFVAAVLGGAFFGDNLSFISDTTIAATRSQGVGMEAKFKANFRVVLPAALVSLALYILMGAGVPETTPSLHGKPWLVVPYLLIIFLSFIGVNVVAVLGCGIVASFVIAMALGSDWLVLVRSLGEGISGMGELTLVTLLAAGLLGVIRHTGGIDWLLRVMTARIATSRGARGVIACLVGVVNLCTANNTVAIITVGTIARDIARRYSIPGARTASLLDTCSCIVQCLIPYGAQTLLATSLAGISPVSLLPYLYYPFVLALIVAGFIIFAPSGARAERE
ncbi:MAG: Na+/H+ antiporter NhaC family protein [Duncaniella sp.]|nr:Na+/H+ antiporter NhaC family protein [Duncaniella sp.]